MGLSGSPVVSILALYFNELSLNPAGNLYFCRIGGLVASILAFYLNDPSLNPVGHCCFFEWNHKN